MQFDRLFPGFFRGSAGAGAPSLPGKRAVYKIIRPPRRGLPPGALPWETPPGTLSPDRVPIRRLPGGKGSRRRRRDGRSQAAPRGRGKGFRIKMWPRYHGPRGRRAFPAAFPGCSAGAGEKVRKSEEMTGRSAKREVCSRPVLCYHRKCRRQGTSAKRPADGAENRN